MIVLCFAGVASLVLMVNAEDNLVFREGILAIRPFGEVYQAASCCPGLGKCANIALQVA